MSRHISYRNELRRLKNENVYRELRPVTCQDKYVIHNGRQMLNLSSNDYLGLAADRKLYDEFLDTWRKKSGNSGFGATSSRLLAGNHGEYAMLEQLLSGYYNRESCLVFNSGYHANTGILPALCTKKDMILADKLVHASLIDGIRLSGAGFYRYDHLDNSHLRLLLSKYRDDFENVFIVTESVFSMDGDVADLNELVGLKKEFDAYLYVDEAHAFGVRGASGLGCAEERDCIRDIDFIVATFGKAIASVGAFVVCDGLFRDYLINRMRTLIFTTALPPVNVGWTRYILEKLPGLTAERAQLRHLAVFLRRELRQRSFTLAGDSHIIPVLIGENRESIAVADHCMHNGYFVLPVRPPAVPVNSARLRISLNSGISETELADFCRIISDK